MKFSSSDARPALLLREYGFGLGLLACLCYLVWRNMGLYPMLFADEWFYSSAARLLPFDKSVLPSYLYLALFRQTNSCGVGFLDCARILNAVLLVGAAPFIYLIARTLCGKPAAALLALACVLAPVSSFTAYFMPEMAYFFLFFVFAWFALAHRAAPPLLYSLATGALLGMMSSVKVHALFLVPAQLAFIAYLCWSGRHTGGSLPRALAMMAAAVGAMVVVKLGLGYLIAGKAGLSFLGNFYGTHADNKASSLASLLALLPAALVSLKGHALALVLLMTVPLAALGAYLVDPQARAAASPQLRALQVFALLMLGAALAMTVMFTATIAAPGTPEGIRLHQRYYDFVYPLLLIIAAAPFADANAGGSMVRRALLALPLAALAWYAAGALPAAYSISFSDTPELGLLADFPKLRHLHLGLTLVTLAVWVFDRRHAARVLVLVMLPLSVFYADLYARQIQQRARTANAYDRAGMLARVYLSPQQAAGLTVFGEGAGLTRALFHIDQPGARMQDLAAGAPFPLEQLLPIHEWVLVVGPHALAPQIVPAIKTDEFVLFKTDIAHVPLARVEFARPLEGGVLAAAEGLHPPEAWGSWSQERTVRLRFAKPLPKVLTILLTANAYGPTAGQEFVLRVGAQRRPFHLAGNRQERFFQFVTDGTEQEMAIEIENPASPHALGQGADTRLLGIALSSMEIGTKP